MVAEGPQSPDMILDPEGRLGERVVLGRAAGLEPYRAEPGEGSQQPIFRYQGLVVPNEAAAEDRQIGNRGDEHNRGEAGKAPPACGVGSGRHRRYRVNVGDGIALGVLRIASANLNVTEVPASAKAPLVCCPRGGLSRERRAGSRGGRAQRRPTKRSQSYAAGGRSEHARRRPRIDARSKATSRTPH